MYGGYGKLNLLLSRLSYQSMAYFLPNISSMFASCSPFLCCTYQADKSGPGKNRYQKNWGTSESTPPLLTMCSGMCSFMTSLPSQSQKYSTKTRSLPLSLSLFVTHARTHTHTRTHTRTLIPLVQKRVDYQVNLKTQWVSLNFYDIRIYMSHQSVSCTRSVTLCEWPCMGQSVSHQQYHAHARSHT